MAARSMPPCGAARAAALALVLASVGCQNPGEPPACLDQRQQARNLALRGEVEQAQVLLDRIKAACGPNSQSDIVGHY